MGAPTSLLGQARAFARDFARDQMPKGYLWDVVDYVPQVVDAGLTGRGGWRWGTAPLGGDIESGILAPVTWTDSSLHIEDQLLFQTSAGRLISVNTTDPTGPIISDRGAVVRACQNPVQRYGDIIWLDRSKTLLPQIVRAQNAPVTAPSPAPQASVATVWGDYAVLSGEDDRVW